MALAGCKLVDQTTFGAKPEPPGVDQLSLALREPDRIPLAVIRFDGPDSAYAEALDNAVDAAEQRKPDVVFDVVSVVPGKGSAAEQEAAVATTQQDAVGLVGRMVDAGADPEKIHLAARVDPAILAREVRVYVH